MSTKAVSESPSLRPLSLQPPETYTEPIAAYSFGGRVRIAALLNSKGSDSFIGKHVTVCGFSRSVRKQGGGSICFVVLSDGSSSSNLQVVVENKNDSFSSFQQLLKCGAGCSFRFKGLVVESPAKGQKVELQVNDPERGDSVEILGCTDSSKYPLAKKEHTKEYLRSIAHLRPRTQFTGAASRIRSQLATASHRFFTDRGFLYIHTPIITASDCEGAGEMFTVTTLLPEDKQDSSSSSSSSSNSSSSSSTTAAKRADSTELTTAADTPPSPLPAPSGSSSSNSSTNTNILPLTKQKEIDYAYDFFTRRAYLTVSGQLAVEPFCCGLGDVYTFGPTFRAEKSHTKRHLAEFWMIEPEIAFAGLNELMDMAEGFVKFCVTWCLNNCSEDIDWFEKNQEEGLRARLLNITSSPFARISYTEAISLLQQHQKQQQQQQQQQQEQQQQEDLLLLREEIVWGMDLSSELERYLTEKIYNKPVIVYNYPKEIKAFYMKINEDGKTVKAMDLLVPKIGELIGGSQREEDLDKLNKMILYKQLNINNYWWYRELRQYGSMPHAGFGVGFERLVMLVTGIDNIRDCIPYPRYPGHAEY